MSRWENLIFFTTLLRNQLVLTCIYTASTFGAPPQTLPTGFAAFAAQPAFGADTVAREALRPDIAISGVLSNAAIAGFGIAAIPGFGIAAIPGFCNKAIIFETS